MYHTINSQIQDPLRCRLTTLTNTVVRLVRIRQKPCIANELDSQANQQGLASLEILIQYTEGARGDAYALLGLLWLFGVKRRVSEERRRR